MFKKIATTSFVLLAILALALEAAVIAPRDVLGDSAIEIVEENIDDIIADITSASNNSVAIYSWGSVESADIVLADIGQYNFEDKSEQIINLSFPSQADPTTTFPIVTAMEILLKGNEGFESEVTWVGGGIGQNSVSVELKVNNTDNLQYVVRIYGKKI